jgi:hypothetical protein
MYFGLFGRGQASGNDVADGFGQGFRVTRPNSGETPTSRKRPRHLPRSAVLAVAIALLCPIVFSPGAALAQEASVSNRTPARIGNIWGGFDHQPTESQVEIAERAAGVAPSAQEQDREARIVRQLNDQLLQGIDSAP